MENKENKNTEAYDFLSQAAHDMRNPLTSVKGNIECILSGAIGESDIRPTLVGVLDEINRLNRLIGEVLDVSRLEGGKRPLRLERFDVVELIRLVMISLSAEGEKKNIDGSLVSPEELYVIADRDAVHRVLYNLIQNAIKFSFDGGKLEISVEEGDPVTVSVKNEGMGIRKEEIEKVFDRFFKSEETRKEDKVGVGLGLYISKSLIDAHGQKMRVESEYGKDCTFSFTLEKGKGI